MQPSINSDKASATTFQVIEAFLEVIGINVVFISLFTILGLGINPMFFAIPIGLIFASAIQALLASNLRTKIVLENDKELAAQLGEDATNKAAIQYRNTALIICCIAMLLNTFGAYFGMTEFTFKADKTAEKQLKQSLKQDLERINSHYDLQFASVALIDSSIAQTQSDWAIYAQRNPSQIAYANKKLNEFVPRLTAQRDSSYSALSIARKKEITETHARFDVALTRIIDLHGEEYAKQGRQEWFSALAALFISALLLFLVWKLRTRATLTEIKCGVHYTMEISQEQSGWAALWFAISDGINGRIMNIAVATQTKLRPAQINTLKLNNTQAPPLITPPITNPIVIPKFKKLKKKFAKTPTPSVVLAVQQQNTPVFPAITFEWTDKAGTTTSKVWDMSNMKANLRNFFERSYTSQSQEKKDENAQKYQKLLGLAQAAGYVVDCKATQDANSEWVASVNVSYQQQKGGAI
jgi:hypothetical protein